MRKETRTYIHSYIDHISKAGDPSKAVQMKKYMRNQFEFLGIPSPDRKIHERAFLKENGIPEYDNIESVVLDLWEIPEREFQYFALSILDRSLKKMPGKYIHLFEKLVVRKSWWDTVDFIAPQLIGFHFRKYPEDIHEYTEKWLDSGNIWLQRSCILFQLKYKKDTDLKLLYYIIDRLKNSNEFFIQKAIGWILREYSKFDPDEITRYVKNTQLKPLSAREAMKVIRRKEKQDK